MVKAEGSRLKFERLRLKAESSFFKANGVQVSTKLKIFKTQQLNTQLWAMLPRQEKSLVGRV